MHESTLPSVLPLHSLLTNLVSLMYFSLVYLKLRIASLFIGQKYRMHFHLRSEVCAIVNRKEALAKVMFEHEICK